jgi:hypothetical protein
MRRSLTKLSTRIKLVFTLRILASIHQASLSSSSFIHSFNTSPLVGLIPQHLTSSSPSFSLNPIHNSLSFTMQFTIALVSFFAALAFAAPQPQNAGRPVANGACCVANTSLKQDVCNVNGQTGRCVPSGANNCE